MLISSDVADVGDDPLGRGPWPRQRRGFRIDVQHQTVRGPVQDSADPATAGRADSTTPVAPSRTTPSQACTYQSTTSPARHPTPISSQPVNQSPGGAPIRPRGHCETANTATSNATKPVPTAIPTVRPPLVPTAPHRPPTDRMPRPPPVRVNGAQMCATFGPGSGVFA